MFFNKHGFIIVVLALGLLTGTFSRPGICEVVDCIVARVDAEIITLTDVRIVQAFGLGSGQVDRPASMTLRQCLEAAVDRKVVISLAPVRIALDEAEIDGLLERIKSRIEPAEWQRRLEEFGLEPQDLRPYLNDILLYEKIIALRFSQSVEVSLKEIEAYYQNVYVKTQEARGEEPLPMVQVLDIIESRIRKEKTEKQISLWIENLRRQAEVRIHTDCLEPGLVSKEESWVF